MTPLQIEILGWALVIGSCGLAILVIAMAAISIREIWR